MFTKAILRTPADTFSKGITSSSMGSPNIATAIMQHNQYCEALRACGLELTILPAASQYPDSTFVEDTAVLTPKFAVITNPGADSRKGETGDIRPTIASFFDHVYQIEAPGTLDGGDICEVEGHFFIGLSDRTNQAGGEQLAKILAQGGYTSSFISVSSMKTDMLHLKSGLAYLGDTNLVIVKEIADRAEFCGYNLILVDDDERYAANCLRINDTILIPAGFPKVRKQIEQIGLKVIALEMSEFQKMDGGLSCLSLRF